MWAKVHTSCHWHREKFLRDRDGAPRHAEHPWRRQSPAEHHHPHSVPTSACLVLMHTPGPIAAAWNKLFGDATNRIRCEAHTSSRITNETGVLKVSAKNAGGGG